MSTQSTFATDRPNTSTSSSTVHTPHTPLATFRWDAHQGLVRLLLQRHGIPRSESDDAAQEAMEALWMARDRYDASRGSSATFVGLVMKGFCSNYRRNLKKRASQQPSELLDERGSRPLLTNRADASAIHAALQTIPARSQDVLRLRFASCLSESQAARVAEMPIDQFRTYTRQALKELQRAVAEPEQREEAA